MTDIEIREEMTLVVPGTGEAVDLSNETACVDALLAVRVFENQVRDAKAILTRAIAARARVLGTKTLELPGSRKATIAGGEETVYDAIAVEDGLRALGMPEDRIREIVEENVTYRVVAVEAKRAAGANEEYAAVIEGAKTVLDKPFTVSVRRS